MNVGPPFAASVGLTPAAVLCLSLAATRSVHVASSLRLNPVLEQPPLPKQFEGVAAAVFPDNNTLPKATLPPVADVTPPPDVVAVFFTMLTLRSVTAR